MAVILRLPKDTKCRRTSKDPLIVCDVFKSPPPILNIRGGSFDRPSALRVLRRLGMTALFD